MKDLTLQIDIKIYDYNELSDADRQLMDAAREATQRSYAPYSHFSVGAAAFGKWYGCHRYQSRKRSLSIGTLCRTYYLVLCKLQYPDQAVETLAIAARNERDFWMIRFHPVVHAVK